MAYDLIIKSPQTTYGSRWRASTVTDEMRSLDALSHCEIGAGPIAPSSIDVISLDDCLATGERSEKDFVAFCAANNLVSDTANEASAAAFVDSLWGITLTFVKLPTKCELAKVAFAGLVTFAKSNGVRITDPQIGQDVDLHGAGELPPGWDRR